MKFSISSKFSKVLHNLILYLLGENWIYDFLFTTNEIMQKYLDFMSYMFMSYKTWFLKGVVSCSADIPYKLVVVCSIERENHSRIVAALDKYRRPPLPLMTHDNMVKYIKDKLTFDIKKPAATPAAEADFEQ